MAADRRGFTLVLVMVTLAVAAALIVPLASLAGTESLATLHDTESLRHRIAAESLVPLLPALLKNDRNLRDALERGAAGRITVALAGITMDVMIQDDTAKLPLPGLCASRTAAEAADALRLLQAQCGLPALSLAQPIPVTGCLEDVFAAPTDAALYGSPDDDRAWSRCVTIIGQRVHAWRASPAVLEAWLVDLRPGLAQEIAQRRGQADDLNELLDGLDLDGSLRREVEQRLTDRTERYSLMIRSNTPAATRQRYVICDAADPPRVLVNWEVAP